HAHDAKKKLVINMSLAFAPPMRMIPPLLRNPARAQEELAWGKLVREAGVEPATYYKNEAKKLRNLRLVRQVRVNGKRVNKLAGPLELIDFLFGLDDYQDVFVVAAAGNNSDFPRKVYGPRLPAFIEGVLGVSAMGGAYSNRDDIERMRDDGMSARGGKAR